jgi:hypothetical protein
VKLKSFTEQWFHLHSSFPRRFLICLGLIIRLHFVVEELVTDFLYEFLNLLLAREDWVTLQRSAVRLNPPVSATVIEYSN